MKNPITEFDRSGLNVAGAHHHFRWAVGDSLSLLPDMHFDLYAANVSDTIVSHAIRNRNIPCWITIELKEGDTRVEIAGRDHFILRKGEAVLLPAGVPHTLCGNSPHAHVSRWSHFNFRVMDTVDLLSLVEIPPVFRGAKARRIGQLNAKLSALGNGSLGSLRLAARLNALGFEMLDILMEHAQVRPKATEILPGGRWHSLTKRIHDQLPADLACEELARIVGLSTTQFFVAFRRTFRMSPMAYVREARLRKAQRLLLYTDLNVSEIAAKVSPWDVSQFSRFFQRQSGMRPSEYRSHLA